MCYTGWRIGVSIPAVHADGDLAGRATMEGHSCFNPRRPRGRRHSRQEYDAAFSGVSIPAVHADGDIYRRPQHWRDAVSIPAVHADGDSKIVQKRSVNNHAFHKIQENIAHV